MLKNQLNKSIRSLSNSKKKSVYIAKNNPKIFQAYEGNKRYNYKYPLNKKSIGSGKMNISKSSRKNTSTYQFPQFSIKFEEGAHGGVIGKGKSSRKFDKKQLDQFLIYQKEAHDIKKNITKFTKTQFKYSQKKTKQSSSTKDQLYNQYQEAIGKIFKALDIFNRGQISEININKWVPQSALYFLGKIFQKIKQFKLTLTEAQFQNLSKPLFNESSEQDIKWFINQVNIKDNILKVSINLNESIKKEELSPIKRRMMKEELQMSKDRVISNTRNSHLNEVMDLIKDKQKEALQKLKIVKQKQKNTPFNILGELNSNQYMIKYRNQVEALKTRQNYTNKQVNQQHHQQKIQKNHLKDSISRLSPPSIKKRKCEKQNYQVPNFTLELPQQMKSQFNALSRTNTTNTDQQLLQQKKSSIVVQKYSNLLLDQDKPVVNVNINSRFRKDTSCGVNRAIVSDQNQRLDKLSNKLQEYIKLNRTKIQNSMDFIRSNSGPKI